MVGKLQALVDVQDVVKAGIQQALVDASDEGMAAKLSTLVDERGAVLAGKRWAFGDEQGEVLVGRLQEFAGVKVETFAWMAEAASVVGTVEAFACGLQGVCAGRKGELVPVEENVLVD